MVRLHTLKYFPRLWRSIYTQLRCTCILHRILPLDSEILLKIIYQTLPIRQLIRKNYWFSKKRERWCLYLLLAEQKSQWLTIYHVIRLVRLQVHGHNQYFFFFSFRGHGICFFVIFFVVVLVLVFCCGWDKYLDIIIDITGIMIFFWKSESD